MAITNDDITTTLDPDELLLGGDTDGGDTDGTDGGDTDGTDGGDTDGTDGGDTDGTDS